LQIIKEGRIQNVKVEEGLFFVLNAKTPHRPIRGEGTIGLIIESQRNEKDVGTLFDILERII
jgi:hypothetical protein